MEAQAVEGTRSRARLLEDFLRDTLDFKTFERAMWVILALVFGYLLVRLLLGFSRRLAARRLSPRGVDIVDKIVRYGGIALVLFNAAKIAGVDLSAVLGAAGVAGIAIGFAAQTSISNVISGLFLFSEKAFLIGDAIQLDSITGTVESVDMLSVKIRSFDNRLVRVPNETMIKSNIVNLTHWPTRRYDLSLTLPYGSDLALAERILRETAAAMPAALPEPEPFFLVNELGPNGTSLMLGVWVKKEDLVALKNALLPTLLARLEKAGMRPAAPALSLASPSPVSRPESRPSVANLGDAKRARKPRPKPPRETA